MTSNSTLLTASIVENETATAGRGGDAGLPSIVGGVVGTPGIGGNATANLTIASTNDTLTISATGGDGGDTVAGHAANGGTSNATVTIKSGNITLDSSSIGGDGGSFTLNSNSIVSGGNGGNATIGLTSNYTDPKSTSVNLTFTAEGGNGGAGQGVGATSGNGGSVSFVAGPLSQIQVPSADVTFTLNLIGGSAGQALNGATPGKPAFEVIGTIGGRNPVPVITTSGNVTINENLISGGGANATETLAEIAYNDMANHPSLSYFLTCTPGAGAGSPICEANITLLAQNATNAYASALGGLALAVYRYVKPRLRQKHLRTAITTTTTHGATTNATANTFNVSSLFANATVSATSGISNPSNQTSIALLDNGPISFANGTPQAAASLNFVPITKNASGPINNTLAAAEFLSSQSQDLNTQNSSFSFSADLNPAQLTPADLVFALSTPTFNTNISTLNFLLEAGGVTIHKIFTTYADAEQFLNQNLDLGPLASFGTAPFSFLLQLASPPTPKTKTSISIFNSPTKTPPSSPPNPPPSPSSPPPPHRSSSNAAAPTSDPCPMKNNPPLSF